jgi:putative Holliday junction resolvase
MRALGVDYGQRRIGLALSDASGMLARPWKTIERTGNASQVARALAEIVTILRDGDEEVATIVLGLPRRLNGEPTDQSRLVARVAVHLRSLVSIPVVLQDERLSSREAETLLAQREKDWRKRKDMIDAMAAAVILQDYLDANERPHASKEDD